MKSIFVLLVLIALTQSQKIDIILSGRNFDDGDSFFGPPDPYVKVSYAIAHNPFTLVGRTETIESYNPDWVEKFQFHYVPHLDQRLQFEIIEEDAMFDDEWASVWISMDEIMQPPDGIIKRHFGKGELIVKKTIVNY